MLSRPNREGLSPATIRNVMADLILMPDSWSRRTASSGRVPTTEAYRYYVEQISGETHLSPGYQNIIRESLAGTTDVSEFLERTSRVLLADLQERWRGGGCA